jgi:predicted RNA binding protein YcfA (HicA-like mRNA interferase family)
VPRKIRQLRSDLRKERFLLTDRGKGSHEVWEHPDVPSVSVTLSGHDGDDARPYQERDVRRAIAFVRRALRMQELSGDGHE